MDGVAGGLSVGSVEFRTRSERMVVVGSGGNEGDGVGNSVEYGNDVSLKMTSRDMKILFVESRHLYPLWLRLYPRKTHGLDRKSNLWLL